MNVSLVFSKVSPCEHIMVLSGSYGNEAIVTEGILCQATGH